MDINTLLIYHAVRHYCYVNLFRYTNNDKKSNYKLFGNAGN
jgi:hypothetical protein